MTELIDPDPRLRLAWRAAVDEFGDDTVHGSGIWHLSDQDRRSLDDAGFADLVAGLRACADSSKPMSEDPVSGRARVHTSYFWMSDGPREVPAIVGFLALRHSLTQWLLDEGGHIGYSVRPSRRREGHASRALCLAVRRAADLGLDRVLLTCDEDNRASARTIERNGGVYEDSRNGKRRYWIPTVSGR